MEHDLGGVGNIDASSEAMNSGATSSANEVFSSIYERNAWAGGSGEGSLPENTTMYREYLQRFLKERNIRTVVDFGCGDWQFSKMIDWSGLQYLGIDVVPSVIRENRRNHGSANISFIIADTSDVSLPPADLLLLKDVLQHWPTRMIQSFLSTLGSFRYALITNCIDTAPNSDCPLGGYRSIDLLRTPFKIPVTKVLEYDWYSAHHQKNFKKATFLYDSDALSSNVGDHIPIAEHLSVSTKTKK